MTQLDIHEKQRIVNDFVTLHGNRIRDVKDDRQIVYLARHSAHMPLDVTLHKYTIEKLRNEFDPDKDPSINWLFGQLQNKSSDRLMLGLIFDEWSKLVWEESNQAACAEMMHVECDALFALLCDHTTISEAEWAECGVNHVHERVFVTDGTRYFRPSLRHTLLAHTFQIGVPMSGDD